MMTIEPSGRLAAATATGFRHRMRLLVRSAELRHSHFIGLEIRLMPFEEWQKLAAEDQEFKEGAGRVGAYEWSGCQLDGGMVLAVRGDAEEGTRTQARDEPFPERTVEMRKLRAALLNMLDDIGGGVQFLQCDLGAEGGATLAFSLDDVDHPDGGLARVTLEAIDDV